MNLFFKEKKKKKLNLDVSTNLKDLKDHLLQRLIDFVDEKMILLNYPLYIMNLLQYDLNYDNGHFHPKNYFKDFINFTIE
jgi:hypothetical protein